MEYERKMLIIKRVILGRNEGKRKYVSRTGLSCKCRVANGSRGRKQGGISRTKRGRSRWKQGEEAGLSKIYKERGINEIYKGREKLILVGEEYVRFNVTHTLYTSLCNSKRERPRGDTEVAFQSLYMHDA